METKKLVLLLPLLALLVLLPGCSSPSGVGGLVAHVTASGAGDARTDGDVQVVVGDVSASLGVRTSSGLPVFLVVPVPLERDEWWVRSESRGFERIAHSSTPLPWWTRPLFLDQDLERLLGMGIAISFEPEPSPVVR